MARRPLIGSLQYSLSVTVSTKSGVRDRTFALNGVWTTKLHLAIGPDRSSCAIDTVPIGRLPPSFSGEMISVRRTGRYGKRIACEEAFDTSR